MTKQLLAATAALALLSGAAVAQTYESTTSRTTTVAPTIPVPSDSYSATRTEKTYTPSGAAVEHRESYKSDMSGNAATQESRVMRPDGSSETNVRKEWSNSLPLPNPVPPAASTTTTTTIQR